jgi:hypothetical protein
MALALKGLAFLRMGVGSASFLLPNLTCTALFYPVPAGSLLAVRLFGCRDVLIGKSKFSCRLSWLRSLALFKYCSNLLRYAMLTLLFETGTLLATAKTPEARRRAVLAGAAVDVLDIVACAWAYLGGEIDAMPGLAFGGGAVSFLILAAVGWRGAALGRVGSVAKAL